MPCPSPISVPTRPFSGLIGVAEHADPQRARQLRTSMWRGQMMSTLASEAENCFDSGAYEQAETLHERLLKLREELHGKISAEYATDLSRLAVVRMARGRVESALPALEEAQAIMRLSKGENHADYAAILHNLAALYKARGLLEEAEPLYTESLSIRRKELGDGHPAYASSLNGLALLYEAMGRLDEAAPLLFEASDVRSTVLGDEHPASVASLENLARVLAATGDNRTALELYEQVVAIRRGELGAKHPAYASSLNNLALQYLTMGASERAKPLIAEARSIFDKQPSTACASHVGSVAELYRSFPAFEDETIPALKVNECRSRELVAHTATLLGEYDAHVKIQGKGFSRSCYCDVLTV